MKITRRKINSLVRQSLKENMEFQVRALAKQELINRIMNLNSYQRLRAAEAELSMLRKSYRDLQYNSYSDLIIRAVEEENLNALQSRSMPFTYNSPGTPRSMMGMPTSQLQLQLRDIYNVTGDELFQIRDGMERDFDSKHFVSLFRDLQRQAGNALRKFLKEHPYVEPPPRSFFQKAGSFLTGKGFNE